MPAQVVRLLREKSFRRSPQGVRVGAKEREILLGHWDGYGRHTRNCNPWHPECQAAARGFSVWTDVRGGCLDHASLFLLPDSRCRRMCWVIAGVSLARWSVNRVSATGAMSGERLDCCAAEFTESKNEQFLACASVPATSQLKMQASAKGRKSARACAE